MSMNIPQSPDEEKVRKMREAGLPEWAVQKTIEQWHQLSIVAACHQGQISEEEATRELGRLGFNEHWAWYMLRRQ